jgi:hypothetical protein
MHLPHALHDVHDDPERSIDAEPLSRLQHAVDIQLRVRRRLRAAALAERAELDERVLRMHQTAVLTQPHLASTAASPHR